MEPPFEFIPIKDRNKKQVKQYFEWYMLEKEKRIKQLEQYANQEEQRVLLDKSPESLIPLWEWFEDKIEWTEKSDEKIQKKLEGVNQPVLLGFKGDIYANSRRLVDVCARRSFRNRNKKELFETYTIWLKNI